MAIPPILVPSVVHGQHRRLPLLATDLCTLHNITNNHDNMAIPPILVPSVITNNHDNMAIPPILVPSVVHGQHRSVHVT